MTTKTNDYEKRNSWNHLNVYQLFVLNIQTWNPESNRKQMVEDTSNFKKKIQ